MHSKPLILGFILNGVFRTILCLFFDCLIRMQSVMTSAGIPHTVRRVHSARMVFYVPFTLLKVTLHSVSGRLPLVHWQIRISSQSPCRCSLTLQQTL